MVLSVQQIKFEIMRYVKELGSDFSQWHIAFLTIQVSRFLSLIKLINREAFGCISKRFLSVPAIQCEIIF